jgi:hypothetical protein
VEGSVDRGQGWGLWRKQVDLLLKIMMMMASAYRAPLHEMAMAAYARPGKWE